MKRAFLYIYVCLVLVSASLSAHAQSSSIERKSEENPTEVVAAWKAFIEFAHLSKQSIENVAPHYPLNSMTVENIISWTETHVDETEAFLTLFHSLDVHPPRRQLGINEPKKTYGDVQSIWQNALNTYGNEESVKNELPHMPSPADYCSVEGYEADIDKFNSWRNKYGFGPEANELIDASEMPDPNTLFDKSIYPCNAAYNNAIHYWAYVYTTEYFKLQEACGCGDFQMPETVENGDPDEYLSPMEIQAEVAARQQDTVSYQPLITTEHNHPIKVLFGDVASLNINSLENVLDKGGFDQLYVYLNGHFDGNIDKTDFLFQTLLAWYHLNEKDKLLTWKDVNYTEKRDGAEEFNEVIEDTEETVAITIGKLNDGSLDVKLMNDTSFKSKFNSLK